MKINKTEDADFALVRANQRLHLACTNASVKILNWNFGGNYFLRLFITFVQVSRPSHTHHPFRE